MEERLRIAGLIRTVETPAAGRGRIRLEVDGTALDAEVMASSGGCHVIELDGRVETLFTARSGAETWVWHRGRARIVERVPGGAAAPAPVRGGSDGGADRATARPAAKGTITPPMPAVVLAVLVEPGQVVARGETLVVLTAMKTETQLAAPIAGRVKAVSARVGAKVRPGEILVEIEPEGGRDGG